MKFKNNKRPFNGKELIKWISIPEEIYIIVVKIQDNNIDKEDNLELILLDIITPLSFGIDDGDGIMKVIIPRNITNPFENIIELNKLKDDKFIYL